MRIVVIGAGALGASYGGRLARSGRDVTLVDIRADHMAAVAAAGLKVDGLPSPIAVRLPAFLPEQAPTGFDLALIASDANGTAAAAETAARLLAPGGFALTVQNGIGNVEAIAARLGRDRVIGGSTMCSFRIIGPGHVDQTHMGPTTIGELDGQVGPRVQDLAAMLEAAGYPTEISGSIMDVVWTKFALNSAINPLCALTGLRLGEIARLEPMDRFQELIMDEIFAVLAKKAPAVDGAALRAKIKEHMWMKFSKPSMLQHIEAGRKTEVDALNGALVREADALGIPVPHNRSLVMLLKGREFFAMRRVHEPDIDYDALERAVPLERRPGG